MRLAFRERSLESLRFGDGDGLRGRTTYVALQGALQNELLSHLLSSFCPFWIDQRIGEKSGEQLPLGGGI